MKTVFVGYENDGLAVHALNLIKGFGKEVCVLEPGAHAQGGTTALFSSTGNLRGRYLRIIPKKPERSASELHTYGIVIPRWAVGADRHVALRGNLNVDEALRAFTDTLMQLSGCHAAGMRPLGRECSKRTRTRWRRSLTIDDVIGGC